MSVEDRWYTTALVSFAEDGFLRVGDAEPVGVVGMFVEGNVTTTADGVTSGYWIKAATSREDYARDAKHFAFASDVESSVAFLAGVGKAARVMANDSYQDGTVKGDFKVWSGDGLVDDASCTILTVAPKRAGYGANERFEATLRADGCQATLDGLVESKFLRGLLGREMAALRAFHEAVMEDAPSAYPTR